MAPSLVKFGTAALAYASSVSAGNSYQLSDTYDYTNFFDKFNFFVSNFDTGNYNDVDPTSGFVNYRAGTMRQNWALSQHKERRCLLGLTMLASRMSRDQVATLSG